MNLWKILVGANVEQLRQLPTAVVQTCVSSPPYWGLRGSSYNRDDDSQSGVGSRDHDSVWRPKNPAGLKQKDLIGIPWRVALALQADGWYLRSDIVWSKPNPMPESVTDRPTKSHEYIFLLAKSGSTKYWSHSDRAYRDGVYTQPEPDYRWENKQTGQEVRDEPADWRTLTFVDERGKEQKLWRRLNLWRGNDYYYDAEAIFEPYAESTMVEVEDGYQGESMKFDELESEMPSATAGLQNPSDTKRRIIESIRKRQGGREARDLHRNYQKSDETPRLDGERWNENDGRGFLPKRKNDDHVDNRKRGLNDWTDKNRDHFSGSGRKQPTRGEGYGAAKGANGRMPDRDGGFGQPMVGRNKRSVWAVATQPYREAHFATYPEKLIEPCILAGSQPGDIVIDTFNGSGTTGVVATGYDRHYIGFELNHKYAGLSVTRISKLSPLFTREAVDLQELLEARRHDHRHSEDEVPDTAPAESIEVSVDASRDAGSDLAEG